MGGFEFWMRCHPAGSLRSQQLKAFLELMRTAFSVKEWLEAGGKIPKTRSTEIEEFLAKRQAEKESPQFGVDWNLFSLESEGRIWVRIHTGTREFFKDHYAVDCGDIKRLPDLSYFKKAILLFRPFEAFISHEINERELKAYDRQRLYPHFERPAILRWFHYMDERLCESVGGVAHCLGAPVFRVERFCEGVLFQITEKQFDAADEGDKARQLEAMEYLGLK